MEDILVRKWGSKKVTGDEEVSKPSLLGFKYCINAIALIDKHARKGNRIAVHGDVDMDGIGSSKILNKFFKSLGVTNVLYLINKEKKHGIQEKHVDYFNNKNKIDLLIILDSSTNEMDIIKGFNCDVIVIDHHEVLHNSLYVKDGEYEKVIINNMVDNLEGDKITEWLKKNNPNTKEKVDDYKADSRMSGAMVLYELLRIYCEALNKGDYLEKLYLYQWVGITLFSDAVKLTSDRNQWYMDKTVYNMELESSLSIILSKLNSYKGKLDKNFISYTFVPIINKAIRAGFSGEALDIILNRPEDIENLRNYDAMQREALAICIKPEEYYPKDYIMKDITNTGVSENYCGVIASRLCGDFNKNTVVFKVVDGIAIGSFRGRRGDVDYRAFFENYREGIYAQGHKPAFGFKVEQDILEDVINGVSSIESKESKFYITIGNIADKFKGENHIEDLESFKRQGYFWRLGVGNSKVATEEEIYIIASRADVELEDIVGKLYKYNVLGIKCKAFEPIETDLVKIYIEYGSDLEMYVSNLRV